MRAYAFDQETCKRIFQENPDRYLDASGDVLPEPRS
jgi:YHS domain-containing protein